MFGFIGFGDGRGFFNQPDVARRTDLEKSGDVIRQFVTPDVVDVIGVVRPMPDVDPMPLVPDVVAFDLDVI